MENLEEMSLIRWSKNGIATLFSCDLQPKSVQGSNDAADNLTVRGIDTNMPDFSAILQLCR